MRINNKLHSTLLYSTGEEAGCDTLQKDGNCGARNTPRRSRRRWRRQDKANHTMMTMTKSSWREWKTCSNTEKSHRNVIIRFPASLERKKQRRSRRLVLIGNFGPKRTAHGRRLVASSTLNLYHVSNFFKTNKQTYICCIISVYVCVCVCAYESFFMNSSIESDDDWTIGM